MRSSGLPLQLMEQDWNSYRTTHLMGFSCLKLDEASPTGGIQFKTASHLPKRHLLLTKNLAKASGKTPIRMEEEIIVVTTENYTLLIDLCVKQRENLLRAILFSATTTPSEVIAK